MLNRNQTNSALPHLPYTYKLKVKDSYESLTKVKWCFWWFFSVCLVDITQLVFSHWICRTSSKSKCKCRQRFTTQKHFLILRIQFRYWPVKRNFPLKQLHVTLQRVLQQKGRNNFLNAWLKWVASMLIRDKTTAGKANKLKYWLNWGLDLCFQSDWPQNLKAKGLALSFFLPWNILIYCCMVTSNSTHIVGTLKIKWEFDGSSFLWACADPCTLPDSTRY